MISYIHTVFLILKKAIQRAGVRVILSVPNKPRMFANLQTRRTWSILVAEKITGQIRGLCILGFARFICRDKYVERTGHCPNDSTAVI